MSFAPETFLNETTMELFRALGTYTVRGCGNFLSCQPALYRGKTLQSYNIQRENTSESHRFIILHGIYIYIYLYAVCAQEQRVIGSLKIFFSSAHAHYQRNVFDRYSVCMWCVTYTYGKYETRLHSTYQLYMFKMYFKYLFKYTTNEICCLNCLVKYILSDKYSNTVHQVLETLIRRSSLERYLSL